MRCAVKSDQLEALVDFGRSHDPDQLPAELSELADHIETCEACQSRLESMTDQLSPPGDARGDVDADQWLPVSTLIWLKSRNSDSIPSSDPPGTTPAGESELESFAVSTTELLDPPGLEGELGRIDDYRIQAFLGRGGMAVVFAAWDPRLQRHVAIKMLSTTQPDAKAQQRFVREARAVAAIDHPNVIAIYEVIERQDRPSAIVMPMMVGGTLQQRLAKGPLDIRQAVQVACQIALALEAAHGVNLIHRDVKPANILFDAKGNASLADFGLVWDQAQPLTAENVIPGTPEYICPEQISGGCSTVQSDVYQLGMTLYAAVTGHPAFQGDCASVLHSIVTQRPVMPQKVRAEVDRDLETILLTSLEKEAEHRYASATTMRKDLEAWLDGRPVSVVRRGLVARTAFWCCKHRAASTLSGAIALAVVVLVMVSLALWHSRDQAQAQLANQSTRVEQLEQKNLAADEAVEWMQSQALNTVLAARSVQMPTRGETEQKLMLTFAKAFEVGMQQTRANGELQSSMGESELTIATLYARGGQSDKAAPLFESSLRRLDQKRQTAAGSNDPELERRLAMANQAAADNCLKLDKVERAAFLGARSCQLYQQLRRRDPDDFGLVLDHLLARAIVAQALQRSGDFSAAEVELDRNTSELIAIGDQTRVGQAVPNVHSNYVQACSRSAEQYEAMSQWDAALDLRQRCVDQWQAYRDEVPGAFDAQGVQAAEQAMAIVALARLQQRMNQLPQARRNAQQAARMLDNITIDPQMPRQYAADKRAAQQLLEDLEESESD